MPPCHSSTLPGASPTAAFDPTATACFIVAPLAQAVKNLTNSSTDFSVLPIECQRTKIGPRLCSSPGRRIGLAQSPRRDRAGHPGRHAERATSLSAGADDGRPTHDINPALGVQFHGDVGDKDTPCRPSRPCLAVRAWRLSNRSTRFAATPRAAGWLHVCLDLPVFVRHAPAITAPVDAVWGATERLVGHQLVGAGK